MSTEAGFRPNTTCSILNTDPVDDTDEFGDPTDNEMTSATGVPISIVHMSTRQFLPSENRMTIVHTVVGRMRYHGSVKDTSRILDERTGAIYMIEGLSHPHNPIGSPVIRMDLLHVNSSGSAY